MGKAEGVVVGWVEDEHMSTMMGLMGGFKLHFLSKIVLDIAALDAMYIYVSIWDIAQLTS